MTREERRLYHREWRKKNHNHIIEYQRSYYWKNVKKARKYQREWARNHSEQVTATTLRSRENNKAKYLNYARKYYMANKDKWKVYRERQKAKGEHQLTDQQLKILALIKEHAATEARRIVARRRAIK